MLSINIVCVGNLKEAYFKDAVAEYAKRLKGFCKFTVTEIDEERLADNPSDAQISSVIKKEGERILKKIPAGSKVVAMCIEGKQLSSEELAQFFDTAAVSGVSNVTFIIGGSYGLWDQVKQRADVKLSMSKMTFPHQLARVMLSEQIYRAFKINQGGKYHK
ncbi:MAG: 23S rRNA (pseudouridine(1915)-N(3))-methyltransferase RlmH [Clostridia bacterium]|nr:23S rRNA (pseudouridine(1915)-N(3))-methyltransferase RlmH [Clostridia bacterium]